MFQNFLRSRAVYWGEESSEIVFILTPVYQPDWSGDLRRKLLFDCWLELDFRFTLSNEDIKERSRWKYDKEWKKCIATADYLAVCAREALRE